MHSNVTSKDGFTLAGLPCKFTVLHVAFIEYTELAYSSRKVPFCPPHNQGHGNQRQQGQALPQ